MDAAHLSAQFFVDLRLFVLHLPDLRAQQAESILLFPQLAHIALAQIALMRRVPKVSVS